MSFNEWRSNSLAWCTSHYLVMHRCTWQTTFTCCLKVNVASFVPQASEHALFQEHTTATVTEVLLQPDSVCGTVCHLICDLIWHWQRLQTPTENISVWIDGSAVHCDLSFMCAIEVFLLTYLLLINTFVERHVLSYRDAAVISVSCDCLA